MSKEKDVAKRDQLERDIENHGYQLDDYTLKKWNKKLERIQKKINE